jgi:hypothetical protein
MTSNYRIHNRGFQLQIPAKPLTSSVLFQEGNKGFTGRYTRFAQEIKRLWKMPRGRLPERARAERGQWTI